MFRSTEGAILEMWFSLDPFYLKNKKFRIEDVQKVESLQLFRSVFWCICQDCTTFVTFAWKIAAKTSCCNLNHVSFIGQGCKIVFMVFIPFSISHENFKTFVIIVNWLSRTTGLVIIIIVLVHLYILLQLRGLRKTST